MPAAAPRTAAPSMATTLLLIGAATAFRCLCILRLCPYTLAEDEAHYWEWSRRLDWSYYSKGPGIAWTIAASEWVARRLGVPESEAAVRLSAPFWSALVALGIALLARAVTRNARAVFFSVLLLVLTPVYQLAGMMLMIDIPFIAMWSLAMWLGWLVLREGSRWAWIGLGAAIGAGFIFKYTILLLPPGLIACAMCLRNDLTMATKWRRWSAAGASIAALGVLPVLIWNAQNHWPTVRHLLGHLGLTEAGGGDIPDLLRKPWEYNPGWMLRYVGGQVGLMLPTSLLMGLALWNARTRKAHGQARRGSPVPPEPDGQLFLVLLAAPALLFYFVVSLVTEVEANWPAASYLSLFVLAGWQLATPSPAAHALGWAGRLCLIAGLFAAPLLVRLDWFASTPIARAADSVAENLGLRNGPVIPIGRLTGAREMAASAAAVFDRVSATTGQQPFYIAGTYGRASQLAYYLPGHPTVYCPGPLAHDRATQYNYWPDSDLADPALLGRPAVLVGGEIWQWWPAFDELRVVGPLSGETKRGRISYIGLGFRGFAPRDPGSAP